MTPKTVERAHFMTPTYVLTTPMQRASAVLRLVIRRAAALVENCATCRQVQKHGRIVGILGLVWWSSGHKRHHRMPWNSHPRGDVCGAVPPERAVRNMVRRRSRDMLGGAPNFFGPGEMVSATYYAYRTKF